MGIRSLPQQPGRAIIVYRATARALAAGEVFSHSVFGDPQDTWLETRGSQIFEGMFICTQASAANGLVVEESIDGVNVEKTTVLGNPVAANTRNGFKHSTYFQYFRLRWIHGATPGVLNGRLRAMPTGTPSL